MTKTNIEGGMSNMIFMKKKYLVILLFSTCLIVYGVNVRDFGATGDGKTDDTAAIQKAISYLASKIKMDRFRTEDEWNSGSSETHVDELYFPAGTYKISRTLFAEGSVAWRGEQAVKIVLDDPEQDILYCRIYRRALFDTIEFSGGRTQIQLWSRNWNASSVHIRNCVFRDSSAPAVRSISRRVYNPPENYSGGIRGMNIQMIPPYEVTVKNGVPELFRNSMKGSIGWFSSNIITVSRSSFLNCMQAFEFDNDGTLIDNCHIVANPQAEGPVMIAGIGAAPNMLSIWNLRAEAPATDKVQYWIKNEGFHLICNDSSFLSERPMLFLEQNTLRIPFHSIPGSVIVNRSTFKSAGNPKGALIDLHRVPCVLKWIDNRNENGSVPLIKWAVKVSPHYFEKDSFAGKLHGIPWSTKHKYNVIVAGNRNIEVNLPDVMKQFCYEDDPMLHEKIPLQQEIPIQQGELKAADFGVVPDGKTDNTSALTHALNAAAKARKTLLIPSGRIRLASTVTLPDFVSLRGEGMPVIFGDKRDGYDLFYGKNPEIISFRSLILRNAKRIFAVELGDRSRLIAIKDSLIYDTAALSIEVTGTENRCQFIMSGSLWNGAGGIVSECNYNEVAMCWFANNFWMDNQAFFTLKKGILIMRSGFFVPYVSKNIRRTNRLTGEKKVWELGDNLRWIDNEGGNVYLYGCRGGGEGGGYSMIRQTAVGGIIYIEGGLVRFTNEYTKNCLFYADAAPDKVLFTGIAGNPVHTFLGIRQKVLERAPGVKEFPAKILGVMIPQEKESHTKALHSRN